MNFEFHAYSYFRWNKIAKMCELNGLSGIRISAFDGLKIPDSTDRNPLSSRSENRCGLCFINKVLCCLLLFRHWYLVK